MNDDIKICPRCKGQGGVWMVIKPIHNQSAPRDQHTHYVTCPQPECSNGKIDINAYYTRRI